MTRLNILLFIALIASSFYLVNVQYESRQLLATSYKVKAEARKLHIEAQAYEVNKRAEATPLRVETEARSQLRMINAGPENTHYLVKDLPSSAEGK